MMVFSYLKQTLPDLTMQIKEMNPILYHYYVILKELELIWSSKNPSSCSAEGNWPITHIGETVKQACDNPFSIGYMKRTCKNENQRAVWSTVDDSLCEEKKNDSYYIYRIIYPKEKANKKKVSAFYERLLDQMNCDHLWVLAKNTKAIQFYERHGFVLTEKKQMEEGTTEYIIQMER